MDGLKALENPKPLTDGSCERVPVIFLVRFRQSCELDSEGVRPPQAPKKHEAVRIWPGTIGRFKH